MGIFSFIRNLHRHELLIITYHGVLPEGLCAQSELLQEFEYRNFMNTTDFESQMKYLRQHFHPISFKDYLRYRNGDTELPPFSIIVTFDDGFLNNYEYAFPILKKWEIPAVFYVATSFIGQNKMLWTEELIYRLNHTEQKMLTVVIRDQEQQYDISNAIQKEKTANHIRQQLKHSLKKEVDEVLEQIRTQLQDVSLELTSEKDQLRYRFMNWNHLREMARNGMEIGSHTHNHVLLSQLDENQCRNELRTSRDLIENNLRIPCILFSYPNGKRSDFSRRDIQILQELGYQCATTQEVGWNSAETDLFTLHRLNIARKMTGIAFETSLALPLQNLRRKNRI